nr:putative transposase En/Spm [Ipomoea batatas]
MSDREEPSIVLISTLKVINMPTYGVGVVQEGGDDLLHNPLVLTKVEVNPIGSTQGLDDHYEIEDESEESEQDDEVVYEDSENDDKENAPSIAQVHHVVLRDHQEVVVKMSQRKRNRGKGKTVTGSHSQADISQPPSLHALIDDPEEGSTPANDLRQSQADASNAQLWSEAIGGVKRGGYVYVFGSDTQHYFPEASRGSNSKSAESSSNAALLTEIQQMREENKMFREEVGKMGAILTQLSPNTST